MKDIKNFFVWPISLIITVVFAGTAALYFYSIQNLVKPATVREAARFFVTYPEEYFLALTMGGIAKIAMVLMFAMAIGVTLRFITRDFWEYSPNFSLVYFVLDSF